MKKVKQLVLEQNSNISTQERQHLLIGRLASIVAILMYVSYIVQIINNLHGIKGNPIQPLVAAVNATLWVIYGFNGAKKDWAIIAANAPGILFGIVTAITCF